LKRASLAERRAVVSTPTLSHSPLFWPVAYLVGAYTSGELSPVEVTEDALSRISSLDGRLHAYLTVTPELALSQAREAERLYRAGDPVSPLLGVPASIKDLFDVEEVPTSLGSLVYREQVATEDSAVVRVLRRAGMVFLGKTNTPEFGQSATTENRLGEPCSNPWDLTRTAGGSSGGAAASVAAGLATVALGSDGGGSIRIPASMCGVFGLKPTLGRVPSHGSFRAMTDFVCAGPLARSVADARLMLSVLLAQDFSRRPDSGSLAIGWCAQPQGHPVQPGIAAVAQDALSRLEAMGHHVELVDLPIDGWRDVFAPLVLADEWRFRRHLLDHDGEKLTVYGRRNIEAAADLTDADIDEARQRLIEIRSSVEALFARFDLIATPATAAVAFPIGKRPERINGDRVDTLWGPFPFTPPFNVVGTPAVSLPVGLSEGLPVGIQLVAPHHEEQLLLDVCEELEEALAFPIAELVRRWT
jgi:Asp-tRNA(Asn)/Glu-tRNA(Gln) amidotransferase A subunit family amidase